MSVGVHETLTEGMRRGTLPMAHACRKEAEVRVCNRCAAPLPGYSPKYFNAISIPSSYIF